MVEEKDLTHKQLKWLEESEKIGPGPMTKTERETLEKLYADMLPAEQKELLIYIEEKFSVDFDETPIKEQEAKTYSEPSKALKAAFAKSQSLKPRPNRKDDK